MSGKRESEGIKRNEARGEDPESPSLWPGLILPASIMQKEQVQRTREGSSDDSGDAADVSSGGSSGYQQDDGSQSQQRNDSDKFPKPNPKKRTGEKEAVDKDQLQKERIRDASLRKSSDKKRKHESDMLEALNKRFNALRRANESLRQENQLVSRLLGSVRDIFARSHDRDAEVSRQLEQNHPEQALALLHQELAQVEEARNAIIQRQTEDSHTATHVVHKEDSLQ